MCSLDRTSFRTAFRMKPGLREARAPGAGKEGQLLHESHASGLVINKCLGGDSHPTLLQTFTHLFSIHQLILFAAVITVVFI